MGMTDREVLTKVELPMASPVILAAVRVATVQVAATATLGALVGWGGLGRFIVDGFSVRDNVLVFAGALLVAGLASDAGILDVPCASLASSIVAQQTTTDTKEEEAAAAEGEVQPLTIPIITILTPMSLC